MDAPLSTKKRILVLIPTGLTTAGILMACWFLLSEGMFVVALVCLAVIATIAERSARAYERKKQIQNDHGQSEESGESRRN